MKSSIRALAYNFRAVSQNFYTCKSSNLLTQNKQSELDQQKKKRSYRGLLQTGFHEEASNNNKYKFYKIGKLALLEKTVFLVILRIITCWI